MKSIRIAVVGCTGRTGQAVVRAVAADPACDLAAAVTAPGDPAVGQDAGCVAGVSSLDVPVSTEITGPCDVAIEFTLPAGCETWVCRCRDQNVPLVSGTTGLSDKQKEVLQKAAESIPIVWSPNMSIGINLMLALAADLAGRLDASWDVEICETHHRQKLDAPSGTAHALLESICRARNEHPDATATFGRSGTCGPRPAGQIGVHALRMGMMVGEHEVHFCCDTECLTVRHRAFSRNTFAAGALRAARWLQGRSAGLYTMRDVLFG